MTGVQTCALPIYKHFPNLVISVDTFRADVAARCVEEFGVGIINDISGGELDKKMFETVARLQVPYIMMHMKGTPQTMQQHTHYDHFLKDIFLYFAEKTTQLRHMGVNDVILDPGFGFAKTIEQNYELLAQLQDFDIFDLPLLVGVSRKSMIYKMLGTTPAEALNGTTTLNTIAHKLFRYNHRKYPCRSIVCIVSALSPRNTLCIVR